jgi:hypothetical protein
MNIAVIILCGKRNWTKSDMATALNDFENYAAFSYTVILCELDDGKHEIDLGHVVWLGETRSV